MVQIENSMQVMHKVDKAILSGVKKTPKKREEAKKDPVIMALVMIYYNIMKTNREEQGGATTKMSADENALDRANEHLRELYREDPHTQQEYVRVQNETLFYDNLGTMQGQDLSMTAELQVVQPSEQNRLLAKEGATLVQFYDQYARVRA